MRKRRWVFKRDDEPAKIEIDDHLVIFIDQISRTCGTGPFIHVIRIVDLQVKFTCIQN